MYELKAKHEGSHACMTNARSEKEWKVDGLWVHFLLPIPCEKCFVHNIPGNEVCTLNHDALFTHRQDLWQTPTPLLVMIKPA